MFFYFAEFKVSHFEYSMLLFFFFFCQRWRCTTNTHIFDILLRYDEHTIGAAGARRIEALECGSIGQMFHALAPSCDRCIVLINVNLDWNKYAISDMNVDFFFSLSLWIRCCGKNGTLPSRVRSTKTGVARGTIFGSTGKLFKSFPFLAFFCYSSIKFEILQRDTILSWFWWSSY